MPRPKPPAFDKMPHTVVLHFATEQEKRYVLGQLSDGWGESYVDLDWDPRECKRLSDASRVTVRPMGRGWSLERDTPFCSECCARHKPGEHTEPPCARCRCPFDMHEDGGGVCASGAHGWTCDCEGYVKPKRRRE